MEIRIGTSGWNYPHWQSVLYPAGLAKAKWLEEYGRRFDTVEVNATFYRLPPARTFANWRARAPAGFLWAVKASRFITHVRRLEECAEPLERLYGAVAGLGEKLGPILFQLPPSLAADEATLGRFCALLDPARRHAFEVRHPSWLEASPLRILADHNLALCIADTAGRFPYHETVTADFLYIRLHGSKKLYASSYAEAELAAWAVKIGAWGRDTYLYFDNDAAGHAVQNALRLRELLTVV